MFYWGGFYSVLLTQIFWVLLNVPLFYLNSSEYPQCLRVLFLRDVNYALGVNC